MKTYRNLYDKLCSYDNLLLAFNKAKKRKSKKPYVQTFEKNLKSELYKLQWELLTGIYRPAPLTTFIVRDPKTRKISASHFRDRIVHHAICNIIEPIYESRFIYDTFANRKEKGTLGTLQRFDQFMRKVSHGFALKADIKKYFENVDQKTLLKIIKIRIKDETVVDLISIVLQNHKTSRTGKGMPLGNLTSQFFANIYLAELDNFVKHELRAKYYIRYVDDFVILSQDRSQLQDWQEKINTFLKNELQLMLHQEKTKIIRIQDGVPLVGFKVYHRYKIIKKSNRLRFFRRLDMYKHGLQTRSITPEHVQLGISGWEGYAKMGNTYKLREEIFSEFKKEIEGNHL